MKRQTIYLFFSKNTMNMNKVIKVALATTLLAATASTTYARSWRVNNDVTKKAHFVDINAAMASEEVQAGDTLYLDPNTNLSSEQRVTKQVTIVGPGWGGGEVYYARAVISGILIITAAETKIVGLYLTNAIHIRADYVTVERCKVTSTILTGGATGQFATIRNCYLDSGSTNIYGEGGTNSRSANWTVENSIIIHHGAYNRCIERLYCATIRNNMLITWGGEQCWALCDLGNALVQNNIIMQLYAPVITIYNCDGTFTNNVISQDYGTSNYIVDNNLASVLTGDYESYTLVEGSPAIGGGTDGQDVGIFGGLYPYVANNGLPKGYPYYTKNIVGAKAVDGKVNVSLKVKIEDE